MSSNSLNHQNNEVLSSCSPQTENDNGAKTLTPSPISSTNAADLILGGETGCWMTTLSSVPLLSDVTGPVTGVGSPGNEVHHESNEMESVQPTPEEPPQPAQTAKSSEELISSSVAGNEMLACGLEQKAFTETDDQTLPSRLPPDGHEFPPAFDEPMNPVSEEEPLPQNGKLPHQPDSSLNETFCAGNFDHCDNHAQPSTLTADVVTNHVKTSDENLKEVMNDVSTNVGDKSATNKDEINLSQTSSTDLILLSDETDFVRSNEFANSHSNGNYIAEFTWDNPNKVNDAEILQTENEVASLKINAKDFMSTTHFEEINSENQHTPETELQVNGNTHSSDDSIKTRINHEEKLIEHQEILQGYERNVDSNSNLPTKHAVPRVKNLSLEQNLIKTYGKITSEGSPETLNRRHSLVLSNDEELRRGRLLLDNLSGLPFQKVPSATRTVKSANLTDWDMVKRNSSTSLYSLLESRRQQVSKLKGLVIPDKVDQQNISQIKNIPIPTIRSQKNSSANKKQDFPLNNFNSLPRGITLAKHCRDKFDEKTIPAKCHQNSKVQKDSSYHVQSKRNTMIDFTSGSYLGKSDFSEPLKSNINLQTTNKDLQQFNGSNVGQSDTMVDKSRTCDSVLQLKPDNLFLNNSSNSNIEMTNKILTLKKNPANDLSSAPVSLNKQTFLENDFSFKVPDSGIAVTKKPIVRKISETDNHIIETNESAIYVPNPVHRRWNSEIQEWLDFSQHKMTDNDFLSSDPAKKVISKAHSSSNILDSIPSKHEVANAKVTSFKTVKSEISNQDRKNAANNLPVQKSLPSKETVKLVSDERWTQLEKKYGNASTISPERSYVSNTIEAPNSTEEPTCKEILLDPQFKPKRMSQQTTVLNNRNVSGDSVKSFKALAEQWEQRSIDMSNIPPSSAQSRLQKPNSTNPNYRLSLYADFKLSTSAKYKCDPTITTSKQKSELDKQMPNKTLIDADNASAYQPKFSSTLKHAVSEDNVRSHRNPPHNFFWENEKVEQESLQSDIKNNSMRLDGNSLGSRPLQKMDAFNSAYRENNVSIVGEMHHQINNSTPSPQDLQDQIDKANQLLKESGSFQHEVFVVILQRSIPGGSIGLILAGGADYESKEITVHKIINGSLASQDGRIQKGDRLLFINGKDLKNVTHMEAVQMLQAPQSECILVLSRNPRIETEVAKMPTKTVNAIFSGYKTSSNLNDAPTTNGVKKKETVPQANDLIAIRLMKDAGGLGFSLEGGRDSPAGDRPLIVKKIFKGGAAERNGLLQVGSEILFVNSTDVSQMSRIEAWHFMKRQPDGIIELIFR